MQPGKNISSLIEGDRINIFFEFLSKFWMKSIQESRIQRADESLELLHRAKYGAIIAFHSVSILSIIFHT